MSRSREIRRFLTSVTVLAAFAIPAHAFSFGDIVDRLSGGDKREASDGPAFRSLFQIQGRVDVIDNQTLRVAGRPMVLWGLRGLDLRQACVARSGAAFDCGRRAAQEMAERFTGQSAKCEVFAERTDFLIGHCRIDAGRDRGVDLGAFAVASGFAFDCAGPSRQYFAHSESFARSNQRGAWSAARFEFPWEFLGEGRICGR